MPTEYTTDDLPIEPPEDSGDYEQIPTGAYVGKLVGFRVQDKPEWKIKSELIRKPEKEPDKAQWEWTFEITDGEFVGLTISDWTNRSWHERSKAAAHACGLLDVAMLPRGQGFTTGKLVGRICQIWVVSKENSKGEERSYVDKILPVPKRRPVPGAPPVAPAQAPTFAEAAQQAAVDHPSALRALARTNGAIGPTEDEIQEAVRLRQASMTSEGTSLMPPEPPDDLEELARQEALALDMSRAN